MIIGLSGYARSGKDTAAAKLVELGYTQIAFADELREFAFRLNPILDTLHVPNKPVTEIRFQNVIDSWGWDHYKESPWGDEMRRLLQVLGTECGRELISDTIWIDAALRDTDGKNIVISDVRFPNEADAVRARGGYVFRVERPGVTAVNAHKSETALDEWEFDAIIPNDEGIGELHDLMAGLAAGLGETRTLVA